MSDVGCTDRMSPSGVSLSDTECAVSLGMSVVTVMVSANAAGLVFGGYCGMAAGVTVMVETAPAASVAVDGEKA